MPETKLCQICKQILSVSKFANNKFHKDGLQSYCKPCKNKYDSIWRKKNRKYVNRYYRNYKQKKRLQEQDKTIF